MKFVLTKPNSKLKQAQLEGQCKFLRLFFDLVDLPKRFLTLARFGQIETVRTVAARFPCLGLIIRSLFWAQAVNAFWAQFRHSVF